MLLLLQKTLRYKRLVLFAETGGSLGYYDNMVIHASKKKSRIAGYTARNALESSSLVPPKKLIAAVSKGSELAVTY